jgi:heme exporter protein A
MLKVSNLDFDYPDKQVLQGVQFTVHPGHLLHLRGANGAGKTTLLKVLTGLLHPTHGDIQYKGCSITDDITAYQQQICYVGHKTGVSQLLTVRENCRFELKSNNHILSFEEIIQLFALQGLEDIPCNLLSVGQRRRVGLMRLVMSQASLWLLDEPLVGLDKDAINLLMRVLEKHLEKGGQIILTSHQQLPLRQENYQEYCL